MSDEGHTSTPSESLQPRTSKEPAAAAPTAVTQPFWREHLGLALSGGLTILLAVKILAIGNYEPETALGVVQVAGTANVLVPSLIAVLPTLLVLGFFEVFERWGHRYGSLSSGEKTALFSASMMPTVIVLSVMPLAFVSIIVALVAFIAGVVRLRAHRASRPQKPKSPKKRQKAEPEPITPPTPIERASTRVAGFAGAMLVAVMSPWMPSEAVSVGDDDPVAAYVVGQRGDETIFLPHGHDEGLVVAKTSEVRRTYCDDRSWMSVTLFQVFRQPAYDDCPDDDRPKG